MPFKPVLTGLGFCLAALTCSAQIVITHKDLPVVGDNLRFTVVTDEIDVQKTGANVVWDFTKVHDQIQVQAWYRNPGDINADFADPFKWSAGVRLPNPVPLSDDYYGFFQTSKDRYEQVGAGVIIPIWEKGIPSVYSRPDRVYNLPLTYGDHDKCDFFGSVAWDQVRLTTTGTRKTVVDGWGKIKTPYGVFDCIRVKSRVEQTDSVNEAAVNASRTEYRWLACDEKIPVFEVIIPDSGSIFAKVARYKDRHRNIINPDAPQVAFSVPYTNVTTKDTVPFINSTPGDAAWQWGISPTSFSFVDKTTQLHRRPKVVFHKPGWYSVSLQATNLSGSNTLTREHYIQVSPATAIGDADHPIQLQIYPTVTSGNVRINIPEGQTGQAQLLLTDISGRSCLNQTISMNGTTHNLDMATLPSGMYFVRLQLGSDVYTGKVIRE